MGTWNRCSEVMPPVGRRILVSSKGHYRVAIWDGGGWRSQYDVGINGAIEFWCDIPDVGNPEQTMVVNVIAGRPTVTATIDTSTVETATIDAVGIHEQIDVDAMGSV